MSRVLPTLIAAITRFAFRLLGRKRGQFPFLRLPTELRYQIYSYADVRSIHLWRSLCHQTEDEIFDTVLEHYTFRIKWPDNFLTSGYHMMNRWDKRRGLHTDLAMARRVKHIFLVGCGHLDLRDLNKHLDRRMELQVMFPNLETISYRTSPWSGWIQTSHIDWSLPDCEIPYKSSYLHYFEQQLLILPVVRGPLFSFIEYTNHASFPDSPQSLQMVADIRRRLIHQMTSRSEHIRMWDMLAHYYEQMADHIEAVTSLWNVQSPDQAYWWQASLMRRLPSPAVLIQRVQQGPDKAFWRIRRKVRFARNANGQWKIKTLTGRPWPADLGKASTTSGTAS